MTIKIRKIRCAIRNILAVLLTTIYSFANYFLLYKLCDLIFTELIAISIVGVMLLVSIIVIIFIFLSQNVFSSLQTENEQKEQEIIKEYDEVIKVANEYSERTKKARIIVSNSDIMSRYSFGSPGVASMKNIFITDDTSSDNKYIVPGVIAHELGHIDSGFTSVMVVCNILNFALVYSGRILANMSFSLLFNRQKKSFKSTLKKIFGLLLYTLSFVVLLSYNILFSMLYISEEKDADLFASIIGYAYSVKYFLSEHLDNKLVSWMIMLVLPLHPFTYNRIKNVNEYDGYPQEMMFTHVHQNTLFAFNGKCETAYFDCEKIGDGRKVIRGNVKKIVFGENVKEITANAFSYSAIESIEAKGIIRTIGHRAFASCHKLQSFTGDIEVIKDFAFQNSFNLTNISLSKTKEIHSYAFKKCTSLQIDNCNNLISLHYSAMPEHLLTKDQYNNKYFADFLVNVNDGIGFLKMGEFKIAEDIPSNKIIILGEKCDKFINAVFVSNDNLNYFKDYLILHCNLNNLDEVIQKLYHSNDCEQAFKSYINI